MNKNKSLFIIITLVLFTTTFISFSPNVSADSGGYFPIVGDQTINYDWLTIKMAEDKDDSLRHNIGGVDLIGYESLGSEEMGEDTLLFKSKITFGYEINSYLALSLRDVFPNIETKWSSYKIYADISVVDLVESYTLYGKFRYNYVSLGTPDYNDHSHNIPMTIGINPTFSALDGKTVNGIPIETSEYSYEVKAMEVVEAGAGFCGDYNDLYTTQGDVSGGVDTMTLTDELSASQQAVINKIESLNLGWETGMTSEYVTSGISIQQWFVDTFTEGEQRTNAGTGDLTYGYPIRLMPEITYTTQKIDVRAGGFTYYPPFNLIAFEDPINSYEINRVISGHVRCPFVHLEYEIIVYLLCSVELDAEVYESALDDPFFKKGDWLWNPIVDSYDPIIVVKPTIFDDWQSWWDEWGWLVILILISIAGVYLFIQIGMPLILKKQALDVVRRR